MSASPQKRNGKLTGKWREDFRHKGQRFISPLFDTKAEADGWKAYVLAAGEAPPSHARHKVTGTTFREVAELCKAAGGSRKGKWRSGRDPSVMQRLEYVVSILGDHDIAAVGTQELDKLVDSLRKRPGNGNRRLSNATINRYLHAAGSVLTFASQRGYIVGKPATPTQEETGRREEVVSEELEDGIISCLRKSGRTSEALCVQVLIETGMRAGELYAIGPEQVGTEWIRLRSDQTKTQRSREVYLAPDLATALRVLLTSEGLPKYFQLLRDFKSAVRMCAGSPELVLHSLRHTRATRLLQSGTLPAIVMEMLGWTSPATMLRYTHVNSQMHAEAAKKTSRARAEIVPNGAILPMRRQRARSKINDLEATAGIEPASTVLQAVV